VHRSRLINRLNEGISQKLTLLSAPAGFGKTMLLSEWVADCGRPVAWVSLDETDGDSFRFWAYLIAALQTIRPNVGEGALVFFQSPQPQPADVYLTALINDIDGKMPPFVMVLDDFHRIMSQQINETLEFFIEHMPPQVHLVISGRADPALSLARLRAQDQLSELRAVDLRFTLEETAAFLNEVMKLELSNEEIAILAGRTEGWVASLQMAGISLKGHENTLDFVSRFSGSHSYILDYLTDEVLSRLDENIRSFLLQTSILKRMTSALCNIVTGREESKDIIKHLENANLFVEPLDKERHWYRYHQLFADLLSAQLAREYPDQESNLHKKASSWFEHEGLMEEAIYHAIAADDFNKAADLIEKVAASFIERSQISTVLALLNRLPKEVIIRRSWLCLCNAWALLLGGQLDKVEGFVQAAEMSIEEATELSGDTASEYSSRIKGHSLAIRAYVTSARGDISRSIELSLEAAKVLPLGETTARSANAINLYHAFLMTGDIVNASKYSKEAYEIASAGSNLYVVLTSICASGIIQMEQGHLQQAEEIFQRAITMGKEWGGGRPLPAATSAFFGLGHLHYEWNHLDTALRFVEQGIELSESAHLWYSEYLRHATLTQIKQAYGENDAALEVVEKMMTKYPPGTTRGINAASWKGRLLLARNDIASLRQWVSAYEALLNISGIPDYLNEMAFLVLCRARVALGEVSRIPELLERLCERAETQGRTNDLIEILTIRALALTAVGNNIDAITSLQKALSLAEPQGYVRTFVDMGPAMQQLLRRVIRGNAPRDYIHHLLDAFPSSSFRPVATVSQPETGFSENLNQRELEILRLMAAGLSNHKIAERLYISMNTVKWYTRGLYSKLGVTGRTQAVNLARDLNLL
jgi:LuxR family maltose regulon positive regulatory protein